MCGVPGAISWSHPGHRYGFVARDPGTVRTVNCSDSAPVGPDSVRVVAQPNGEDPGPDRPASAFARLCDAWGRFRRGMAQNSRNSVLSVPRNAS